VHRQINICISVIGHHQEQKEHMLNSNNIYKYQQVNKTHYKEKVIYFELYYDPMMSSLNYIGDMQIIRKKICLAVENEFNEIKVQLAREKLQVPHACNVLFFKNLISHFLH
jgi:hypothetical protein